MSRLAGERGEHLGLHRAEGGLSLAFDDLGGTPAKALGEGMVEVDVRATR